MTEPEPDCTLDLNVVATELLRDTGNNRASAHANGCRIIEEYLRANTEEAVRLAVPILANRLWDAIRANQKHGGGNQGAGGGRPAAAPQHDVAAGLRHVGSVFLFNFLLPNGMRLGDATREMVERNREVYRRNARESVRNERWLDLIASTMPPGETRVRDCFTPEALRQHLRQAERETGGELETGGDRKALE